MSTDRFDDKLTELLKKFHFMEPGLISDILNQVNCDLEQAAMIITAMIPPDQNNKQTNKQNKTKDEEGTIINTLLYTTIG